MSVVGGIQRTALYSVEVLATAVMRAYMDCVDLQRVLWCVSLFYYFHFNFIIVIIVIIVFIVVVGNSNQAGRSIIPV